MVKKLDILTTVGLAVGAHASCENHENAFRIAQDEYSKLVSATCNLDSSIVECLDAQFNPSIHGVSHMLLKDSRGFALNARISTDGKGSMSFVPPAHCEEAGDEQQCIIDHICAGITSDDDSMPTLIRPTGGVIPSMSDEEAAAERLAIDIAAAQDPEAQLAIKAGLLHEFILQTEAEQGEKGMFKIPALMRPHLTMGGGDALKSVLFEDEEIQAQVVEEFLRAVENPAVQLRRCPHSGKVRLVGEEVSDLPALLAVMAAPPSEEAAEHQQQQEEEETLTSRRLSSSVTTMSQLRAWAEKNLQLGLNGKGPGKNMKTNAQVVAAIQTLLPRDFDPRVHKRDSSLPDTRHCFSVDTVLDQGNCGSCWAFAAATEVGLQSCVLNNKPLVSKEGAVLSPSPQQLMDCKGQSLFRESCKGGYMENTLEQFGTFADYPYYRRCNDGMKDDFMMQGFQQMYGQAFCDATQKNSPDTRPCGCQKKPHTKADKCPTTVTPRYVNKGIEQTKLDTTAGYIAYLKAQIYFFGASRIGLRAHDQFIASYATGIQALFVYKSSGEHADPKKWKGQHNYHAVNVIGWGVDQGREYWIMQNSWSATWGDQGTFRVYMDDVVMTEYPDFRKLFVSRALPYTGQALAPSPVQVPRVRQFQLEKVVQLRRENGDFHPIFFTKCEKLCKFYPVQAASTWDIPGLSSEKLYKTEVAFEPLRPMLHLLQGRSFINVFSETWDVSSHFLQIPMPWLEQLDVFDATLKALHKAKKVANDYTFEHKKVCGDRTARSIGRTAEICDKWFDFKYRM